MARQLADKRQMNNLLPQGEARPTKSRDIQMEQQAGTHHEDPLIPIVAVGRNCWRIERADRATVVIDAAAYYRYIYAEQ